MTRAARIRLIAFALLPLLLVVGYAAKTFVQRYSGVIPLTSLLADNDAGAPAPLAVWPLPSASPESTHRGVTHWMTSEDGTTVDVFRFSWKENPRLHFEILDGDSDDDKPWDNRVRYWQRGVGAATRLVNDRRQGEVLAAWNGMFFGYASPDITSPKSEAFHVSPVVIDGVVHEDAANHRWTFGVKFGKAGPKWSIAHLPSRQWLQKNIQWGAGAAQCLVLNGKPLALQPVPAPGAPPLPQPVQSTAKEAGHIPLFDHMRTSRASLAWEKDGQTLWLVFVKESDGETASKIAFHYRRALGGGWTTADVQRFWLALQKQTGPLTAINSDAGDVAQLTYRHPDGDYTLLPPRWSGANFERKTFTRDFKNAPAGGKWRAIPHTADRLTIAASPRGNQLMTSALDGTVQVWNTQTGTHRQLDQNAMNSVATTGFSHDGRLALVSWDGRTNIFDAATHRFRGTADTSGWKRIGFSTGDRSIRDGATGRSVRIQALSARRTTASTHHRVLAGFRQVAFSPDGRVMATLDFNRETSLVYVWDETRGRVLRRFPQPLSSVAALRLNAVGKLWLFGRARETENGSRWQAVQMDLRTGASRVLWTRPRPDPRDEQHMWALSADGKRLVYETLQKTSADKRVFNVSPSMGPNYDLAPFIEYVDAYSGKILQRWPSGFSENFAIGPLRAGRRMVAVVGSVPANEGSELDLFQLSESGGSGPPSKLWRATDGDLYRAWPGQDAMSFSPDARWLATGAGLWQTRTGKLKRLYPRSTEHLWLDKGHELLLYRYRQNQLLRIGAGAMQLAQPPSIPGHPLLVTPHGHQVVSVTKNALRFSGASSPFKTLSNATRASTAAPAPRRSRRRPQAPARAARR